MSGVLFVSEAFLHLGRSWPLPSFCNLPVFCEDQLKKQSCICLPRFCSSCICFPKLWTVWHKSVICFNRSALSIWPSCAVRCISSNPFPDVFIWSHVLPVRHQAAKACLFAQWLADDVQTFWQLPPPPRPSMSFLAAACSSGQHGNPAYKERSWPMFVEVLSLVIRGTCSARQDNMTPNRRWQVHPHQKVADAVARLGRHDAALRLLGEDDPDAEPLKVDLKQARMQARVCPIGERLDLCRSSQEASGMSRRSSARGQGSPGPDGGEACEQVAIWKFCV